MRCEDPPPELWPIWQPLWSRRSDLGGWGIGLATALVTLVIIGGGYLVTLKFAVHRGVSVFDSRTEADAWFGPTPWAMGIYMTLYLYLPLQVACAPRTRKGWASLLLSLQAGIWLALFSFATFLVAPTFLHTRGEMEAQLTTSSSWAVPFFESLYLVDAPYNAWPSLHVSLSLLFLLTAQHLMRGRFPRPVVWAWWPAWAALLWSILATKQHHAFDIWTGAIAGAAIWALYLAPRLASLGKGEVRIGSGRGQKT
ncbi:MAG: phosphatase PAP2 family protein [bacterium]|jgi:hypothetical protein|nr:phosphatase PAP2 family protein [Planctomycetota bacterium]